MQTLISLFVVGASGFAASKIYRKLQKEKQLKTKLAKIAEERFQEWLKLNRFPKLEPGVIGDVLMCVHPEDREHHWDSNITRWSRPRLESSWGFYGTGPHLMAEDILFQFTRDARFSQWGEPVRALVEELICFVPLDGGVIKADKITAIIARYWDKMESETEGQKCS